MFQDTRSQRPSEQNPGLVSKYDAVQLAPEGKKSYAIILSGEPERIKIYGAHSHAQADALMSPGEKMTGSGDIELRGNQITCRAETFSCILHAKSIRTLLEKAFPDYQVSIVADFTADR